MASCAVGRYRREDYIGTIRHLVIIAVDLAVILFVVLPLGTFLVDFMWPTVDEERQMLRDLYCGTRLVRSRATPIAQGRIVNSFSTAMCYSLMYSSVQKEAKAEVVTSPPQDAKSKQWLWCLVCSPTFFVFVLESLSCPKPILKSVVSGSKLNQVSEMLLDRNYFPYSDKQAIPTPHQFSKSSLT